MRKPDPRKNSRKNGPNNTATPDAINLAYNDEAGALKMVPVGPKLDPIPDGNNANKFTTNCSSATKVGMGNTMAFWAPSAGATITFGDSSVALLAAGVVDSGGKGFVGIPLVAGWNYYNSDANDWLITSPGVICYLISDGTYISSRL